MTRERRAAMTPMGVVRSAGVIGIATMTSRVLGLLRDQVLAYYFGAGDAMDAFRIAFRIPNVLRDLFAEGAMSAALVPTFTRALAAGDRTLAWRLASNVISLPARHLRRDRGSPACSSPSRSSSCTPQDFATCRASSS